MIPTLLVRSANQGALHHSPVLAFGTRSALRMPPSPTSGGSSTAGHPIAPSVQGQPSSTTTATATVAAAAAAAATTTTAAAATQSVSTSAGSLDASGYQRHPFELGYIAAHGKGRHLHEDV